MVKTNNNTLQDGKTVNDLAELFDYFRHLPKGFWGVVHVKFRDGEPYLVEEIRQIKLGNKE